MTTALIIIVIVLGASVAYLVYRLSTVQEKNQTLQQKVSDELRSLDDRFERRMNEVKEHVTLRTRENMGFTQNSTREVNDRLTSASKVIGDLRERITAFEEGSKKITDLGKNISELQNVFKAQKMRGIFGEQLLETLLLEVLPKESVEMQYRYKTGDVIVDAIVKFKDSFLPIDAKFPYENFVRLNEETDETLRAELKKQLARDFKKHVDAISTKYISKEEKSLDVAFMYIPAENVYYEVVIRDDETLNIRDYCFARRVVPVSPSTLYAYIQIVLLGMKGMQVSKKAKEILDSIKTLESEFSRVLESYDVMGNHLVHAQQKYSETSKYLEKFGNRMQSTMAITEVDDDSQPPVTELPLSPGS